MELAILELDFRENIKYCSKAFTELVNASVDSLENRKIDEICDPQGKFREARHELQHTTKRSVNFAIKILNELTNQFIDVDVQGVLVRTRHEGLESHSMFYVISPPLERAEIEFNLSADLLNIHGFQQEIFATYLRELETAMRENKPPPSAPVEICRICERPVKTWWFERHHWLCAREHKNEERVIKAREALIEQKKSILNSSSKSKFWLRHSVRVSSPLSSNTTSPSLLDLVHFCDQALMLNTNESRQSIDNKDGFSPWGKTNYTILRALKSPPTVNSEFLDETLHLVNELATVFEQFVKFRQYRKLVWQEVETQVYLAIDKLLANLRYHLDLDDGMSNVFESDDERFSTPVTTPMHTHHNSSGSFLDAHTPQLAPSQSPVSVSRRPSRANLSSLANRRQSGASMISLSSQMSSETEPAQLPSVYDYEGVSFISRGSYGSVFLAKKKATGDLFAIKVLRKKDMVAKRQVTHVKHERRVLIASAASPYIATLFYSFQSTDYLYLVLEYVPNGDVASLLKSVGLLSEDIAKQYMSELALAVNSVHKMGILHRDLKPENLLIDKLGHLKLSDFGLSVPLDPHEQTHINAQIRSEGEYRVIGTPDYISPEALKGCTLDQATDWWSVGCILYELVYGMPPFNDETPQQIFENILKAEIFWPDLPPQLDVTPECKDLVKDYLNKEPRMRLDFLETKNHPFFTSVEWDRVFSTKAVYIPAPQDAHKPLSGDEAGLSELLFPNESIDLVFSLKSEESTGLNTHPSSPGSPVVNQGSHQSLNSFASHGSLGSHGSHQSLGSHQSHGSHASLGSLASQNSMGSRTASLSSYSSFKSGTTSPVIQPYSPRKPTRVSSFSKPELQTRLEDERSEFGSFSYRNLDVLEQKNNEVISKIKATPDFHPQIPVSPIVPSISLNDNDFQPRVLIGGNARVAQQLSNWGCSTVSCNRASDVCLISQTNAFHLIVLNFRFDDKLPESEVIKIIRETLNPSRDCVIYQLQPNWETDLPMILYENFGYRTK